MSSYVALKEVPLTSWKKNNLDDVIGVILSSGLKVVFVTESCGVNCGEEFWRR